MSHIPSSAMPHPHAHGDAVDDQPAQPEQRQPAPEPTTALPPEQPAIPAPVQAGAPEPAEAQAVPIRSEPGQAEPAADEHHGPSVALIAGVAVGAALAVGGLVAAVLPWLNERDEPKGKRKA